jgi:hypothetical protein
VTSRLTAETALSPASAAAGLSLTNGHISQTGAPGGGDPEGGSRAHSSAVQRLSEAASSAMAAASRPVSPPRRGPAVGDDEAVAQLRRVTGGRDALLEVAQIIGQ